MFTDRIFVGVALIGGMTFAGLFTYLSASSFLFQLVYELDPQQYGLLFAVNSIGIAAGTQVSARLTKYVAPQWILAGTTAVMLACALAIVVLDSAGWVSSEFSSRSGSSSRRAASDFRACRSSPSTGMAARQARRRPYWER